jgi:hypothetical protein
MNLMDVIAKAKAEKATSLDLSQQELRIVPPEVFEIDSLEELNLDRNKLVELPDELGQLKNLKSLKGFTNINIVVSVFYEGVATSQINFNHIF